MSVLFGKTSLSCGLGKYLAILAVGFMEIEGGEILAAEEYMGDGVVIENNEAIRWDINRARYAPEREADRLELVNTRPGSNGEFDVAEDTDGVDDFTSTEPGNSYTWEDWKAPKWPFAPNALLSQAAHKHGLDLAATQLFQHASPSSTYYPVNSSTLERHALEGYINVGYGFVENLLASNVGSTGGFVDEVISPRDTHVSLFVDEGIVDRGHRKCILNYICNEIGIGYHQDRRTRNVGGTNFDFTEDYYTYDVGLRANQHFFTGTIFNDLNGDDLYDRGEGRGEIEIRLFQQGVEHAWFDRSGTSGSFAVPLEGLTEGYPVFIELINTSAASQTVSLPMNYDDVGDRVIEAGESVTVGRFLPPSGSENVGFREMTPVFNVGMLCTEEQVTVSFSALIGLSYEVQQATDLVAENWETVSVVVADSNAMSFNCSADTGPLLPSASFRVRLLNP